MIKKIIMVICLVSFVCSGHAINKKTKDEYVTWLDTKCKTGYNIYQAKENVGILACFTVDWNNLSNDYKKLIIWAILSEWSTYKGSKGVIFRDYYSEKILFKKYWKNKRERRRQNNGHF